MKTFNAVLFTLIIGFLMACSDGANDVADIMDPDADQEIPAVYEKIYGASRLMLDGDFIVIKTTGMPDHKSVYYPTTSDLYEPFSGTTFEGYTFQKNPNTIASFDYTFRIPLNPEKADRHAPTPLGAIGVSLNGVPFFNQYAGPNQPLTDEYKSFDQYLGHPTGNGTFHYHVEPTYLTTVTAYKSALLGFLLDGFPVYGPEENGAAVENLDEFHGHSHVTADFPEGIYHYHVTNEAPYINGNGFYGQAGTVSQ
ncbi:YHYH protein [Persicobacter psychrovividus]|uniref:YHYH domain-containing protein n=1 Tax=Persicobacter psychrovividus TaxID=387638 RepID=A0ABN6LCQ0_9BACT|nr:hypothetical protein PEPS_32350 [Persicobacter psychrovividus]